MSGIKWIALFACVGLIAAGCGDDDGGAAETGSNGTSTSNGSTGSGTSNGTTGTSNGTTGTSNGTTATSNGTTATSNGTTATSNGTTGTSNGTTGTSNGTTGTSNGTTGTSNGTTGGDDIVQCQAVCVEVTSCEEMVVACGAEVAAAALEGCNVTCEEDEESRGLILMASGLPCNLTVDLFIDQAGIQEQCQGGRAEGEPLGGEYDAFVIGSDFLNGSEFVGVDLEAGTAEVISTHEPDTVVMTVGSGHSALALIDRQDDQVFLYLDPSNADADPLLIEPPLDSNPQDVEILDDGTVYLSLYDSPELQIIPADGELTTLDLSVVTTTDTDGQTEVNTILYSAENNRAYVFLQVLDRDNFFASSGPGVFAVIDTTDHTLVDMDDEEEGVQGIVMPAGNPLSSSVARDGRLAIVLTESFGDTLGQIALFDPAQETFETLITEVDLEGDVNAVAETSAGWFVVSATPNFTTRLYFLGADGPELLIETAGFDLGSITADPSGDLLLVNDGGMSMPGLYIWGDGDEPTGPIMTGTLPPRTIAVPR